jgi:hypothetical protein
MKMASNDQGMWYELRQNLWWLAVYVCKFLKQEGLKLYEAFPILFYV